MKQKIFISYSRKDFDRVEQIINDEIAPLSLTITNGTSLSTEAEDMDQVVSMIDDASMVLLFVSSNTETSKWVHLEFDYAVSTNKQIVPVMIDESTFPIWLQGLLGENAAMYSVHDEKPFRKALSRLALTTQFKHEDAAWTEEELEVILRSIQSENLNLSNLDNQRGLAISTLLKEYPVVYQKILLFYYTVLHDYRLASILNENGTGILRGAFQDKKEENTDAQKWFLKLAEACGIKRLSTDTIVFDGSKALYIANSGKFIHAVLDSVFARYSTDYQPDEFNAICDAYDFSSILRMPNQLLHRWLDNEVICPVVKQLSFDRFLCYKQPQMLDLSGADEVYFIGENGDGKTVLLMALLMAFRGCQIRDDYQVNDEDGLRKLLEEAQNINLIGTDDQGLTYGLNNGSYFPNFFAYGTHRGRYVKGSHNAPEKSLEKYGFRTIFNDDLTLQDPRVWLNEIVALKAAESSDLNHKTLFEKISKILDGRVEITVKENDEIGLIETGFPTDLYKLSEGARSTLIFVCDLLNKLKENSLDKDHFLDQRGVVLIDEIDQHLHISWQRKIVSQLHELLPNMQFILTTHSPYVIQGAKENAKIYRLRREGGETTISDCVLRKNLNEWMINTLVTSPLFGLKDARLMPDKDNPNYTSQSYIGYRIEKLVEDRVYKDNLLGSLTDEELEKLFEEAKKEIEEQDKKAES